jgi:hypothetical protein
MAFPHLSYRIDWDTDLSFFQNQRWGPQVLQALKQKGAPIYSATRKLGNLETAETFSLIKESQHPIYYAFRVLQMWKRHQRKCNSSIRLKDFKRTFDCGPHDPHANPDCIWGVFLSPGSTLTSSMPIPQEYQRAHVFKLSETDKYGLYSGTIFEQALEALEMVYCVVLEQGEHYCLPSGHINRVISRTRALQLLGFLLSIMV